MVKSTEYNIAARQILSTYIHSIVIKTILFVYLGHDPSLTDRDARKIIVCSIYSTEKHMISMHHFQYCPPEEEEEEEEEIERTERD